MASPHFRIFLIAIVVWLGAVRTGAAQECEDTPEGRICRIPQSIVAGVEVGVETQRQLGLVSINGCSGILLNRFWVLTARHCITAPPAPGGARTTNDLISNPFAPASRIRVTADWAPGRVGLASRIHDFAANAAILAANVNATNVADIVPVYLGAADLGPVDSQRIYMIAVGRGGGSRVLSGRLRPEDRVTQYGRGFGTLATGIFGTPSAVPAQGSGIYRSAQFTPSGITDAGYTLAMNAAGQVGQAGDDAGAPDIEEDAF